MPEENTHNSFLVVLPSTTTPNAPQTTPFLFLFLLFLFRHFTPRPLFGPFPGDGDDCGNFERFSRPENSLHRKTNSQNPIKGSPWNFPRKKHRVQNYAKPRGNVFPASRKKCFSFCVGLAVENLPHHTAAAAAATETRPDRIENE